MEKTGLDRKGRKGDRTNGKCRTGVEKAVVDCRGRVEIKEYRSHGLKMQEWKNRSRLHGWKMQKWKKQE